MAYTESLFLALALGSLLLAWEVQRTGRRDALYPLAAGLVAALAALTRHQGLFVALSVGWLLAVAPRKFSLATRARNALLGFAPAVLAFGGFVAYIGSRTGHLLSVFQAHDSWGKDTGMISLICLCCLQRTQGGRWASWRPLAWRSGSC